MSRRPRVMPGFASVAAGSQAVVDLPVTGFFRKLYLEYRRAGVLATEAQVRSDISEIRILINGVTQRRFSGAELLDINAYRARPFSAGQIEIYLSEPWRRTLQGEDVLGWGMQDVESFQIEVDIDAGAVSPGLTGEYLWEPANVAMGQIIKWRKQTVPVTATGLISVTNLADPGEVLSALHFFSTNFDQITLIKDDVEEVKVRNLERLTLDQRDAGFIRQATMRHLDFGASGRVSDFLSIINLATGRRTNDLRLEFNMTAATSFTMLVETQGLRG